MVGFVTKLPIMNKTFAEISEMEMFSMLEPAILEEMLNCLFKIKEKTNATTETEKQKYVRIAFIEEVKFPLLIRSIRDRLYP